MKIIKPGGNPSGSPPGGVPWEKTRRKPPPASEWAPNRLARVWLECGCFTIPWPLVRYLGVDWVHCDTHGEQKVGKAPAYVQPELPDEPEF